MAASVEPTSRYHALPSPAGPERPSLRRTLSHIRSHPLQCLQSFLAFEHYAILSYCLILTHFLLLYLAACLALFDCLTGSALPPRPYVVLLSFFAARSAVLVALFSARLRYPALWYPSASSALSRRFLLALAASRLLSASFLVFGSVHWLRLTAHAAADGSHSWLLASPAVPCLLVREAAALLLPAAAVAYLRAKGQQTGQVSAFLPYRLAAAPLSRPAADGPQSIERRGLTAADIARLGEERYRRAAAGAAGEDAEVCAICLAELVDGMRVRRLRCAHGFHASCVDEWLRQRPTCPLCVQHCAPAVSCSVAIGPLLHCDGSRAAGGVEMRELDR